MEEQQKITKKSPLSLVLNGGKDEIDSATVPVKWIFEQEFFKSHRPTHLLFVEQTAKELNSHDSANNGRRYIVAVDNIIEFVEMFSSGKHRLTVFAFRKMDEAEATEKYLKRYLALEGKHYARPIYDQKTNEGRHLDSYCSASTSVEFIIPKELFAQKPKSFAGKAFWKYLNWPLRNEPIDQCKTRLKVMIGVPKLLVYLPWQIVKLAFFTLYTVYMMVAPTVVWFFGYCPQKPSLIWGTVKAVWKNVNATTMNVLQNVNWGDQKYRYWYWTHDSYEKRGVERLFSPFEIALSVVCLVGLFSYTGQMFSEMKQVIGFFVLSVPVTILSLIFSRRTRGGKKENFFMLLSVSVIIIFAVLSVVAAFNSWPGKSDLFPVLLIFTFFYAGIFGCTIIVLAITVAIKAIAGLFTVIVEKIRSIVESESARAKREAKRRTALEKKRAKEMEKAKKDAIKREKSTEKARVEALKREEYLKTMLKPVEKVILRDLPAPQTFRDGVKRFRVGFWALKAKVCKPYDQES